MKSDNKKSMNQEKREPSFGHGGNIFHHRRHRGNNQKPLFDFSANINPAGPPEWLRSVLNREMENLVHYPDPLCLELKEAAARYHAVEPSSIIPANGTTELLYTLPQCFPGRRIVLPVPSYIDYRKVFTNSGHRIVTFALQPDQQFDLNCDQLGSFLQDNDLVILGSPNNPTGNVVGMQSLLELAESFSSCEFIIDEAFLDFVGEGMSVAGKRENITTLNSMTKFYALAGLRIGYGVFSEKLAASIQQKLPPWTVNHLAQVVGSRCLEDKEYQQNSRENLRGLRTGLIERLEQFADLTIFPSEANYLLIRLDSGTTAQELYEKMLENNIIIRVCDNYEGLDESYFRIAVRTEEENRYFIDTLTSVLKNKQTSKTVKRMRPQGRSLMFQGTSSNAGKSVLTAALCRILLQDGVRVAPFKAQNMSLNSFVTLDGLEMGRAQVVQAQAARLDPDVRMNPVLLKPNSDTGSQVIVHGKAVGNMNVTSYHQYKQTAMDAARRSYIELASEFDAVILEGAGSPGEVNLKKNDFVNMAMAQYAKAPVLLVGDIDRGGIYASFIGTMDVLTEQERECVAGFVVNRFRGLASLLDDAHRYVKDYTGKEVFGVIPYLSDLGLPEEDSVSFKAGLFDSETPENDYVDIALINLGHISNFTDLEPFLEEPDVHLRVISAVEALGNPDCIIIPGSKNVMDDILQLRNNGLLDEIAKLAQKGCEIVGICGGYQILGRSMADPVGIESSKSSVTGLGLLDIETTLMSDKTLVRKTGVHRPSGLQVFGYEIHHGKSHSTDTSLLLFDDQSVCGTASDDGRIWGSYLHGIFDSDQFRRWFIDRIRSRKGYQPVGTVIAPYDLEPAFDRLADVVREYLDMDKIYRLLQL